MKRLQTKAAKIRSDAEALRVDESAFPVRDRWHVVYWHRRTGGRRTVYFASREQASAKREFDRLRRIDRDQFRLGVSEVIYLQEWRKVAA